MHVLSTFILLTNFHMMIILPTERYLIGVGHIHTHYSKQTKIWRTIVFLTAHV